MPYPAGHFTTTQQAPAAPNAAPQKPQAEPAAQAYPSAQVANPTVQPQPAQQRFPIPQKAAAKRQAAIQQHALNAQQAQQTAPATPGPARPQNVTPAIDPNATKAEQVIS